jgi:hypothetical protein
MVYVDRSKLSGTIELDETYIGGEDTAARRDALWGRKHWFK